MPATQQKLGSGQTLAQRYDGLGFSGQPMHYPLERLFGIISGPPDSGKSCLFQGCPDAFILNLDLSSTTNPQPAACIWPGITPGGEPMDVDGSRMELTWKALARKHEQLLKLAADDAPRPRTIVLDSLGSAISMARDHVVEAWNKKHWTEIDGRAGWEYVYDGIIRFGTSLRKAGYGFFFVAHVVNQVLPMGEDRYVERHNLTITPNFWSRFFPFLEFSAVIYPQWTTESHQVRKPDVTTPDGKTIPGRTVTEQIRTKRYVLTTTEEQYAGITKSRVPIESLSIPLEGGWATLAATYTTQTAAPRRQETTKS